MEAETLMTARPNLAEADHEDEPVLVRSGVTLDDYLAMPETMASHNLIQGRLYMSPTPIFRHQQVVGHIYRELFEFAAARGDIAILSPMDCHLPDGSVLQPDVIYINADRADIIDRWVMGAPDLVIEVLSPGTRRFDRSKKLAPYERNGVREAWLVDPVSFTVIVFSSDGATWIRERSAMFGEHIPSDIVAIGSAGLEDFA
jgi:Uma2 family endonuclease